MDIKLRNRGATKLLLTTIIDLILSIILGLVLVYISTQVLLFLYRTTRVEIINMLVDLMFRIAHLSQIITGVIIIGIFSLITYKRTILINSKISELEELRIINSSLLEVVEVTREMANGDLERTIPEKQEGNVLELTHNINKIVSKLKNITIEEKRAQQTKTDLITNISHDLRTPLTSIMGYLSLIERDKYRDEVQLRYYTNIAYEKSKSLNLLITDLFELTKMQNSGVKLEKNSIDMVELLGQIISQFQYEISSANMISRLRFSQDKLIINGDGNKLVRAFENLITNAIKYGTEGVYVDIFTRKEDGKAIIEVVNYGEEISQTDIEFIFDRFYRIEKSRNREGGGTGLGLSITKSIIELHGGEICALSQDGRTIFRVSLLL